MIIFLASSVQSSSADKFWSAKAHNGIWIIQLEDAPTVRFEGDVIQSVTADGRTVSKALEATAPEVTGVAKMDVNTPAVQRYVTYLDDVRAQVLNRAEQQIGRTMRPRHIYRHVLNGFAVEMSEAEARTMAQMPGVKSVEPDYVQFLQTDAGPQWIGATRFWAGTGGVPNPNRGEGMVLGVVDTGINWESIFLNNSGPGITPVINPRPNFLGLCSDPEVECSGKLIGVYDFTDEDTKGKDPDSHGSHVATTALGIPLSFSLPLGSGPSISFSTSGVAPRASLISYKACVENPDGGNFICRFADTSAALEQAIVNQVDVVNYSIGGPPFSPWLGTTQQIFRNMRAAGIVPVVAAGNDGPNIATVGSPANAPWVLAAANATHDRVLANQLINTSGGSTALGPLTGLGSTGGTGILPIVHAKDFGNALCGIGTAQLGPDCASNSGATSPFPPGIFNGRIVVCDRGVYGRIEKGRNVLQAGAAGMILANTQAQGESINSDQHCLPATHVGAEDGDRLRDWLDSGSNHSGSLTGTTRVVDNRFGGRINNSSSRGPAVGAPGLMKPNVTAPGTDVLAAGFDGPNSVAFLTGTSMASPHVAGAALLLRNSHPDWGVDEVISALETTADASIVRQADDTPARIIDRGAGGIQVDLAARIGLYLPTSTAEFVSANPAIGGEPGDLNLPGIVGENCGSECTFTRRVRALGNSTWTVSTEGGLDIQATPASFTLAQGQEQIITVTIRPAEAEIGNWGAGFVVLQSSNTQFVTQRLPVGATVTGYTSDSNRGRGTLKVSNAEPLSEAIYRTSALVRPEQRSPSLRQDPTGDDAYDTGVGVFEETFAVPPNSLLLHVETLASASLDVDLFVGQDFNGNNRADEDEELCSSTTITDLERCLIERPQAGTWWIVVQNWSSSVPGATDTVPFEFAVLSEQDDPSLVVSGIANHPGGDLELPVYWDQPAMLRNERWIGAIGVASSPDTLADAGIALVSVTRTGENAPEITPLFEGRRETIVIPPATEHDTAFIDVPEGATSLTATITGSLDDVVLRGHPFSELDGLAVAYADLPPLPVIGVPSPPNDETPVTDIQQTPSGWEITVVPGSAGTAIQSGRYYFLMQNDGASESRVDITVEVEEPSRIVAQRGLWGTRDRPSIFQGFQWDIGGGNAFIVWYTYDEDGISTFYLSNATEIDESSSYLTLPIYRYTSNGIRQTPDRVGDVQITAMSQFEMSYAWTLNGTRNAELQVVANGPDCPTVDGQTQPLLGLWFPNGVFEGGASALVTSFAEVWVRYYFDDTGQPRWVYADGLGPTNSFATRRMNVNEYRGACIYCDPVEVTIESVGFLERQFDNLVSGNEILQFQSRPPLNQSYSTDRPLARLSSIPACSN